LIKLNFNDKSFVENVHVQNDDPWFHIIERFPEGVALIKFDQVKP